MLLLLLFLSAVSAYYCPDNYRDDGNGNCLSNFMNGTRVNAYIQCNNADAYLRIVPSSYANGQTQKESSGREKVWLGLTCTSNNTKSCLWDNGTPLDSSSFSNFYAENPNVDTGACVLMLVSTGKWYSADCANLTTYYQCENTPGYKPPRCGSGYYFRGHCYWGINVNSFSAASSSCNSKCGRVASIHSDGENSFVHDIGSTVANSDNYMFTGLQRSGSAYYWNDNTPVDYRHFGYENAAIGSCVTISKEDDIVHRGYWISSPCSGSLASVCKKNLTNNCDSPITDAPPLAPFQCTSTVFKSGSGPLYSPGYPYGSQPNNCEYLITEDEYSQVELIFNEVSLDSHSSISLYYSFFDKTPFATLTNGHYYNRVYYSTTNMIKIVYNSGGSENYKNFWIASYRSLYEESTTGYSTMISTMQYGYTTASIYYPDPSNPFQYSGNGSTYIYPSSSGWLFNNNTRGWTCVSVSTVSYVYDDSITISSPKYTYSNQYYNSPTLLIDFSNRLYRQNNYNPANALFCSQNGIWIQLKEGFTTYVNYYYFDREVTTIPGKGTANETYPNPYVSDQEYSDKYGAGTISSRNYPSSYTNNLYQVYRLHSNNTRISMYFTEFYTEGNWDVVTVYDGPIENNVILTIRTGNALPKGGSTFYSSGSLMTVAFQTDGSTVYKGWSASFRSIE